jgi:hypothetical protein
MSSRLLIKLAAVGLAVSLPVAAAIVYMGTRPDRTIEASPTQMATTATVTAPAVTVTRTVEPPPASPSLPAAPPSVATHVEEPPAAPPAPVGTLAMLSWQNHSPYSDTCAQVIVVLANRSDTAVNTITVSWHYLTDGAQ